MPKLSFVHFKARWIMYVCMAAVIVGLPVGCAALQHKERELLFNIEPGTASWYSGLPAGVQEFELKAPDFGAAEYSCLVVARAPPGCSSDPVFAWFALEPDWPAVPYRAVEGHGVFGAGHRLSRFRSEQGSIAIGNDCL